MKNLKYFIENVNADAGNSNTLHISFINGSGGAGRFNVVLSEFLPCSAHDFNILCDMITRASDPAGIAKKLNSYITTAIIALQKCRECAYKDTERAEYTSIIKKFAALNSELVKRYGVEKITDAETVKFTICRRIFARGKTHGSVAEYSGHKFIKYGHLFYVAKIAKKEFVCYAEGAAGIPVSQAAATREAAAAAVTPRVIELLKRQAAALEEENKIFLENLINAGYIVPDEAKTAENAAPAETAGDAPKTAETAPTGEQSTKTEKAPKMATQAATTHPGAPNIAPHNKKPVFYRFFEITSRAAEYFGVYTTPNAARVHGPPASGRKAKKKHHITNYNAGRGLQ